MSDFEVFDEFSNFLKACKDDILTSKRVLSEKDFKGRLVFLFFRLKIWERASKLIKIVVKEIYVVNISYLHGKIINFIDLLMDL